MRGRRGGGAARLGPAAPRGVPAAPAAARCPRLAAGGAVGARSGRRAALSGSRPPPQQGWPGPSAARPHRAFVLVSVGLRCIRPERGQCGGAAGFYGQLVKVKQKWKNSALATFSLGNYHGHRNWEPKAVHRQSCSPKERMGGRVAEAWGRELSTKF